MANLRWQINLQSKTLTDTLSYQSVDAPSLTGHTTRNVLGRLFTFYPSEYHYDEKTKLYEVSANIHLEMLLNADFSASGLSLTAGASDVANALLGSIGTVSCNFDDFTPVGIKTIDSTTNKAVCNETYGSALQKLFGWTDIIPTTLVNVFIRFSSRGPSVHCLQRGYESGIVDITGYCADVVRSYKLMRLLFSSNKKYYLTGEVNDTPDKTSTTESDGDMLISGQFTENSGQQTLTYAHGLLTSEAFNSTDGTITSTATYDYSATFPPANLLTKTTSRTENPDLSGVPTSFTDSQLPYKVVVKRVNTSVLTNTMATNGVDLIQSTEQVTVETTTRTYTTTDAQFTDSTATENHTTTTYYSDMLQGQWSVVVYKDGVLQSNQVVTGNPGAKASPYSIKQHSTYRSRRGGKKMATKVELSGKFAGSMSINVSDSDTISRIADAIESLNGQVQETVTLTYYGTVLVDFLKRVAYKSNVYYLDSNTISITPQGTRQQLTLVRWYTDGGDVKK